MAFRNGKRAEDSLLEKSCIISTSKRMTIDNLKCSKKDHFRFEGEKASL